LEQHLNALEANNEMLKGILSESDEELTAALNALMKSQEELTRLKAELTQCKNDAESARKSLQIANEELRKASESFKASEAAHDKTESRLRTQRNIWEALFAVAVGVAVAR
jgi:chromosome segregation ATPase